MHVKYHGEFMIYVAEVMSRTPNNIPLHCPSSELVKILGWPKTSYGKTQTKLLANPI